MLKTLKNFYLKATKKLFETTTEGKRSPHWGKLEKQMIAEHPLCAACGAKEHLQVHHRKPFHIDPSLELDPKNLVVLCMVPGVHCHFVIGHGSNWKCYNGMLNANLQSLANDPSKRASIIVEAKKNRLMQ